MAGHLDVHLNDNPCGASEMTAAVDHYGRLVQIRIPEALAIWQGKKGLECLVCRRGVEPFRSRRGNLFLRHEKSEHNGEFHPTAAGFETYRHKRAKYWVRDQLRAHGVNADVEQPMGQQIPDVSGQRGDGRTFAVEIQWSPLDYEIARQRTQGLRAAGCDHVVWLTRDCDWVEKLPALGVVSFDPELTDYRAHIGYFAIGSDNRLYVQNRSIATFLEDWTTDALAWAYRNRNTAGWATVTDWEIYTQQQADTITEQRRQLADAGKRQQQHDHDMAVARAAASKVIGERDACKKTHQDAVRQIAGLKKSLAGEGMLLLAFGGAAAALLLVCIVLGLIVWLR